MEPAKIKELLSKISGTIKITNGTAEINLTLSLPEIIEMVMAMKKDK